MTVTAILQQLWLWAVTTNQDVIHVTDNVRLFV
jgi:hypothetical protein